MSEDVLTIDLHLVATEWLRNWSDAYHSKNLLAMKNLLAHESHWRDISCLTPSVRTFSGTERVSIAIHHAAQRNATFNWSLNKQKQILRNVVSEGVDWLEFSISFETNAASCEGLVRLKRDATNVYGAWTIMTSMVELKDVKSNLRRKDDEQYIRQFQGPNWADQRVASQKYDNHDPDVLVVGGGHAGLCIAARLNHFGIDTLVIDKHSKAGDNWRTRYRTLKLHNKTKVNHMPFMPFPKIWETYLPKDKLSDWLAYYVEAMEINLWMNTECRNASRDEQNDCWSVTVVDHQNNKRKLKPKHIVMAPGVSALPRKANIAGLEKFKGITLHSHEYKGANVFEGKRVIVIGTGTSGHDISQDLQNHGVQVSIVQRGPTLVQNVEPTAQKPYELYEGNLTTEQCDLISVGTPMELIRDANRRYLRLAQDDDRDLHDGLRAAGFQIEDGSSHGMNWQMLYLTRGGGYYFNVGCSNLIIENKIPVIQFNEVLDFLPNGVQLRDGRTLWVDAIITATGYHGMSAVVSQLFGNNVSEKIGPVWGIDEHTQELANMWMPTPQEGLWFIGGSFAQCRIYSHHLALQIQAQLNGITVAH